MSDQRYTNRLINEKSPYLLQHSHNPVDWYPWGKEAFSAALQQDKPIFLSIGYATCHWCHVMEEESFQNEQVARMMNEAFINIKVDREELPEVDSLYMEFAQSMISGAVGWPLNVLLTPELKPFFAATYLPPHGGHGLMGVDDLIRRINEIWKGEQREKLLEQASRIVDVFSEAQKTSGDELPEFETIENAAEIFFKQADPVYGGIKGVPKFPIGYQSSFLMRCYRQLQEGRALFLVERTLDMMSRGGIYDHLGGGFSRYSIDEKWFLPHFEKMLYDNAILSQAYLEGWIITHNPHYRKIAEEILNYVLRDMTHPEGGFYSAEDADSEGHEGYFYTWTLEEVEEVLGKEESQLFCRMYSVTADGNFEGRNILHTPYPIEEMANRNYMHAEQMVHLLNRLKQRLWDAREKRVHPFKDDKILSSWNGLMIHALAEAGVILGERRYLIAAEQAARFIKKQMWKDGQLLRRWRDGEARYQAGLDEYAFLIKGVLSLFEAGRGVEWLQWAIEMTTILQEKFKSEDGAFLQTDGKDESLILRKCQFADGAEPSGNAVHAENLLRLYAITWNNHFRQQSEDILKASKKYMENYPLGYCYHLLALQRFYDSHAPTIVVALNDQSENEEEIRNLIYGQFLPHKVVIWKRAQDAKLVEVMPYLKMQLPIDKKTTLYICHQGVCKHPLTDIAEMASTLKKL